MNNPVLIFGAGPLGRIAKEIFESNGIVVYGFLDDDKKLHSKEIDTVTVLGDTDDDGFLKLIGKKCEAFVASDDTKFRKTIVKMLHEKRHVQPMNAAHKQSLISPLASIGYGNFFDLGASVGPGVKLGNHCLLHAKCHVGAESVLEDFVQIGAGSIINTGVTLEEEAFIGSGSVIVSGVTIGKGARVGAGSVVIRPVKDGETVFGNPAVKVNS